MVWNHHGTNREPGTRLDVTWDCGSLLHVRKLQSDFEMRGPWCLLVENRDEWGRPFCDDFGNELLKKMGGQPPLKERIEKAGTRIGQFWYNIYTINILIL